jgi:TonB family protein
MHLSLIQEGGLGAWAALALGALGCLLGLLAVGALIGRSRAAFTLGVLTLVLSAAAAGAGMAGTVYGRQQTDRALAFVGSRAVGERVQRAGYRESRSSSWVGLSAALVLLALGGVGALLGSRLKKPQSRVQGFAEPRVVVTDENLGQSLIAAVFVFIASVACVGAWMMAHAGLPEGRYDFPDQDTDSWLLAEAIDELAAKEERGCEGLAEALGPFWGATDLREWPRKMRREVSPRLAWRAAADRCAKDILDALDGSGSSWTRERLLDSALLQDEGLHTRALTPPDPEPAEDAGGGLPKEEIARTVHEDLDGIRGCYEAALRTAPTLEGKVMVEFVVGPDGRVRSAQDVSDPAFPRAGVAACVVARFKALRFPRVNGGGAVTVRYPFVFKAG